MSFRVSLRLLLAVVAVLFVAGCGSDSPTTTAATTTTTTTAATDSTTTTTTAPSGDVIEITVEGGKVVGGAQRHKAKLGDSVTLRVTSDVADEVHLHGYDKKVDVAPGYPAELTFTADIPGVFEVELEGKALPLGELEVS
jgi:uncharacterized cupredoxin-like copper-binding protein